MVQILYLPRGPALFITLSIIENTRIILEFFQYQIFIECLLCPNPRLGARDRKLNRDALSKVIRKLAF